MNQEDLDEFMKTAQGSTFDLFLTESASPQRSKKPSKQWLYSFSYFVVRKSIDSMPLQPKEVENLRKSTGNIKLNQQVAAKTRNGGKIISSKDWQVFRILIYFETLKNLFSQANNGGDQKTVV